MATERNEIVTILTVSADPAIAKAREFAAALDENLRAVERNVAGNNKLGTALDNSAKVSARQKRALDDVLSSMDPSYAAHQRLAQETEKLALASRGLVSQSTAAGKSNEYLTSASAVLAERQKQLNQIQTELSRGMITGNQALERISAGMGSAAGSTKLTAQQMAALAPQVNDVVTQIASGTPIFQTFAQQGGQIVQAVGGMGNAFRLVASPAGAAVTAVAAVGTVAAVVVARMAQISNEAQRLTTLTQALNPQLGATAAQLRAISFAVQERGGSRSEGMAALEAVIANTRIQSAALAETIAKLSVDLAAVKGGKPEEWATKLADAAGSGAQGFSRLLETLPGISAETLQAARAAEMHGDRLGAVNLLIAELEKRYGGAAKNMRSAWGEALHEMEGAFDLFLEKLANSDFWQTVARGAKIMGREVKNALRDSTISEQILALNRQLLTAQDEVIRVKALKDAGVGMVGNPVGEAEAKVADLEKRINALIDKARSEAPSGGGQTPSGSGGPQTPLSGSIVGLNDQDKDKINLATEAMDRQAAGAKLLSTNLSVTARASAENRIALAEMAMQYPGLGARTADAILTSKDFAATLKTLPPELQRTFAAMEKNSGNKLAGDLAMATIGLTSEANAARLAAEAAGLGEAAMRQASIEAEVYAHRMDGTAGAVRAAREQQEQFAQQQIRNDFTRGIDLQVAANERLVAAMRQGVAETRDAEIYNKAVAQAMRETVPQYDAAGNATGKFSEAINRNIAELKRQQQSADKLDLSGYAKQLDNARRALEFQQKTVGMSGEAKAVAKAEFDTLEYARQRYGEYNKMSDAQRREVDALVEAARQNAILEQSVQRQQAAWDELTGTLEKAFERLGDAIVQAFVQGRGEAVNWGNITKSIIASIITDLVKMAAVRPLTNAIFGQSQPTLWDAVGGAKSGGATSTLTNAASNWGMGRAFDWVGNQVGLGGITNSINTWGYTALGIGTPLYGTAGLTAASGGLASVGSGIGVAAVPGGVTNVALAPTVTGVSAGTGLTSILGGGAAGAGIGGMIGTTLFPTSKVGAGLTGAASGALIGYLIGGPIGALLGGAGGGLFGAIGAQKPSSEYGGAWVQADASGNIYDRASGADSTATGKLSALEQRAQQANDALFAITKAAGLTVSTGTLIATESDRNGSRTKVGGWDGPVVSTSDDPAQIAADVLRYLVQAGKASSDDPLIKKALGNLGDASAETMGKVLQLAKGISDASTGLSEMDKSLTGVTASAKKTAAAQFDALKDPIALADQGGIGTEMRDLLTRQLRASFDPAAQAFTAMEVAMAQLDGQTQATLQAVKDLGLGLTEAEVRAAQAAQAEKLRAQTIGEFQSALNDATGKGFLNQITGLQSSADIMRRNLIATGIGGQDAADMAGTLLREQVKGILSGLSTSELGVASQNLTGDLKSLADSMIAASKATQDNAASADLQARMWIAVGNTRTAALIRLDAQQAAEMAQAKAAGQDTTLLAQIQAAERGRSAFDLARQDYLDAIDQQIKAINDNSQSSRDLVAANQNLANSYKQAINDRLLNTNISPLSPLDRLNEARKQVETTYAAALAGDADARNRIVGLLNTRDEAARSYYASSDSTDFYDSQQKLSQLGITAGEQLDTAEQAVKLADQQIKELQRTRDAASKLGERQLISLDNANAGIANLKSVMDQSYVVWQQALPALQAVTGQNWYGNSNQVNGVLNNLLSSATAESIQQFRPYFMDTAEHKTAFYKRENELGQYFGRDSYASPFDSQLAGRADQSFADAGLNFLHSLGYNGGWSPDANIFVQAHGYGGAFTDWVRQYAIGRGWPGFATGTDSAPPGMAWVGERGPELVRFAGGERVYPHQQSMGIARSWTANDNGAVVAAIREGNAMHRVGYAEMCKRMEAMAQENAAMRAELASMRREMTRSNTARLSA